MREIKFRGKSLRDNKWVYGLLGYCNFNHGAERSIIEKTELGSIIPARVFDNTISQYTGLTDKNGKEIYEGDIVKLTKGLHGYKSTYNTYITKVEYWVDKCGISQFKPFNTSDMIECEVIGNIYDNSELLEDKVW